MIIYYRKKSKRVKKTLVITLVVLFVISLVCLVFIRSVSPIIVNISEEEVRAVTSNAVREATIDVLGRNSQQTPEIITYDKEGNISSVQINHNLINTIVQECGLATQNKLAQLGMRGIDIPIGSLSGFVFLAGKGPNVKIKILPVGSVHVEIKSEFTSRGINQTNHKIYLSINSDVNIVLPGSNNSISALAEIIICDTIIVGKIPSVYLGSTQYGYDFIA